MLSLSDGFAEPALELKFGIETELRSRAVVPAYLAGLTAYTGSIALELYQSGAVSPIHLFGGPYLGKRVIDATLIRFHQNPEKMINAMFDLCRRNPVLKCFRPKSTEIRFMDRASNEVISTLKVGVDPYVLEVHSTPFLKRELDGALGEVMDVALFKATKKSGLTQAQFKGEGHVHIDFRSLFFDQKKSTWDYQLFRNYIVDWVNHDELYYGALHYDPKRRGAEPLLEGVFAREPFKRWLSEYDLTLERGEMNEQLFKEFRRRLQIECGFNRNSALNVMPRTVTDSDFGTIEIRALRNRTEFTEFKSTFELLQGRAEYLKSYPAKLPYYEADSVQNSKEAVNRFYRYVAESKLDYEKMKKLLPKPWQKLEPMVLPDQILFKRGLKSPGFCFRNSTWFLIHVLGK